jgi:hypothetical protein
MVEARCWDRLAALLALATMPQVWYTAGEYPPEYVSEWREYWADEFAARAISIRAVLDDLAGNLGEPDPPT